MIFEEQYGPYFDEVADLLLKTQDALLLRIQDKCAGVEGSFDFHLLKTINQAMRIAMLSNIYCLPLAPSLTQIPLSMRYVLQTLFLFSCLSLVYPTIPSPPTNPKTPIASHKPVAPTACGLLAAPVNVAIGAACAAFDESVKLGSELHVAP